MYCNGASSSVKNSNTCTVPISQLTTAPFSLILGEHIHVKVSAINAYGESPLSSVGNGGYITFLPDPPTNFVNNPSITASGVVGLIWMEGASNGGESVFGYKIQFAFNSSSSWSDLITYYDGTSYTVSNLNIGAIYKFRIASLNIVGLSAYS
jgi:hypothetical protein